MEWFCLVIPIIWHVLTTKADMASTVMDNLNENDFIL